MGTMSSVTFVGPDEFVVSGPAGVTTRDPSTAPLP